MLTEWVNIGDIWSVLEQPCCIPWYKKSYHLHKENESKDCNDI